MIAAIVCLLVGWGVTVWCWRSEVSMLSRDLRAWRWRALSVKATVIPPPLPHEPNRAQTQVYTPSNAEWAALHSRRET
jgi:hypothetical protein